MTWIYALHALRHRQDGDRICCAIADLHSPLMSMWIIYLTAYVLTGLSTTPIEMATGIKLSLPVGSKFC